MKLRYILAGAGLLHSARAIPAYITTVFSCPDVVTITQTVYPPGWTNTGPIYTSAEQPYTTRPLTEPRPPQPDGNAPPPQQETCREQGLTTSWETDYATRTVYFSEYGMYSGPPGCPPTIFAYMPTTVTCSEPQTTGWVGYAEDIACASCTATTLVGLRPEVTTNNGNVATYYTVWTEVYVEAGATTQANMVGSQWTATGEAPYAAPYAKQCTRTGGGGGGGGDAPTTYPPTYTGAGATPTGRRGYPTIDYNDPNVFNGGQSVPIESNGYTGAAETPAPAPTGNTSSRNRGYPTIDYNDPNVFGPGSGIGSTQRPVPTNNRPGPNTNPASGETTTRPPSAETATGTTRGGAAPSNRVLSSYPPNYDDPNVFAAPTGGISIVSLETPQSFPPPVSNTRPIPTTAYGANFASVDFEASENFRPLSVGAVTIVSLETPQSFPPPVSNTFPSTSRETTAYPSIDYSNPSVFRGMDPNGGGNGQPAETSTRAAATATAPV